CAMRVYRRLPRSILEGLHRDEETLSAKQRVSFHYHDIEEWLKVTRGGMSFFTLGGDEHRLSAGEVLHVPQGEVHRIVAGPEGAVYEGHVRRGVAVVSNRLNAAELDLLRRNLKVPDYEDGRLAGRDDFFEGLLSSKLRF